MGLAERKVKQRIMPDPRNKAWENDKSKFGFKMLERMGWSEGKGLGVDENGRQDFIKVIKKSDTIGRWLFYLTFRYLTLLAMIYRWQALVEPEKQLIIGWKMLMRLKISWQTSTKSMIQKLWCLIPTHPSTNYRIFLISSKQEPHHDSHIVLNS